jgi:hypothetical protein
LSEFKNSIQLFFIVVQKYFPFRNYIPAVNQDKISRTMKVFLNLCVTGATALNLEATATAPAAQPVEGIKAANKGDDVLFKKLACKVLDTPKSPEGDIRFNTMALKKSFLKLA